VAVSFFLVDSASLFMLATIGTLVPSGRTSVSKRSSSFAVPFVRFADSTSETVPSIRAPLGTAIVAPESRCTVLFTVPEKESPFLLVAVDSALSRSIFIRLPAGSVSMRGAGRDGSPAAASSAPLVDALLAPVEPEVGCDGFGAAGWLAGAEGEADGAASEGAGSTGAGSVPAGAVSAGTSGGP